MTCPHCARTDAATTERGLRRHITRCKSNPANITEQDSVGDRVRKLAGEKLGDVERLLREIAKAPGCEDEQVSTLAADAIASLDAYRELVSLL